MGETSSVPSRDGWETCPRGAVVRLSQRLRKKRLHENLRSVAGGVVLGVAFSCAVFFGIVAMRSPSKGMHGGIACHRVLALAGDYVAGNVDDALGDQIQEHLSRCTSCRETIEAMQAPVVSWNETEQGHRSAPHLALLEAPFRSIEEDADLADSVRWALTL